MKFSFKESWSKHNHLKRKTERVFHKIERIAEDNDEQKKFYNKHWKEYISALENSKLNIIRKELYSQIDFQGKTILDLGCGAGDILKYLEGYKEYLGIDFSENLVRYLNNQKRENQTFLCGDIREKQMLGKRYDIVLVNDVLHHTGFNPLKYIKTYIKKDGILIVNEPILKDCKGKNIGFVWFGISIPETKEGNKDKSEYCKEHPKDFEFSFNEIMLELYKNKFINIKNKTNTFKIIPFSNKIFSKKIAKLERFIEIILLKIKPNLKNHGSRYFGIWQLKGKQLKNKGN